MDENPERIRCATATRITALAIASALLAVSCGRSNPSHTGPDPDPPSPDSAIASPLVIEEIVPGNVDFRDERGEDPGWAEISNIADTSVSLGAWRFRSSDDDDRPWRLPDTVLPPGGRMLVFFSGLDRRSAVPAGDTLSGFTTDGHAWSDSLNDPPGRSSFGPWEIPKRLWGTLMPESLQVLSATMTLRDPYGTPLEWSSVEVAMYMPRNFDAGGRDRMVLRATLPEGQPLLLRFCETGQECWKGATYKVMGSGKRLDAYDFSLLGIPTDWRHLAQVHFIPPTGRFGAYRFTIAALSFYRSARRPHASFELRRKGGTLYLEDTAGARKRSVAYPEMPATASWSRIPGTFRYVQRETPSPEAENPPGPPPSIPAAPSFRTAPGYYPGPAVARFDTIPGAVIRCADGGIVPGPQSPDAREGIPLDTTRALSCAAFDSSGRSGPVVSGLFLIGEKPALPVVSIIVDSEAMFDSIKGLYMEGPNASPAKPHFGANYWEDTEIPAEVAFYERDMRTAFSERAGVSIFGNWSRAEPKRPLSVQFREKYGARRIEYPLFPDHPRFTRFKGFALRNNGGNYAAGFSRDALGTLLTEGRGLEYQFSRHVAVYLNGRYWGIYDLRERLDADYLDTRFGLPSDAIELIKNGGEVQAGTAAGWNSLIDWFLGNPVSDPAALATAAARIDLDNLATYLAAEIWASNGDWPANNSRVWRRISPVSPWRMMLFDLDGGLAGFSGEKDMFAFLGDSTVVADYPNGPRTTILFRRLSANPAWRSRFVNRLCVMLATDFAPARALAALDSMQKDLAGEIDRDAARWNLSRAYRTKADTEIRSFLERRPADVMGHMRAWYGLEDTAGVVLSAEGGTLSIEGFEVGARYAGVHFEATPLRVRAFATGKEFEGWSDGEKSAERTILPGPEGVDLTARFR